MQAERSPLSCTLPAAHKPLPCHACLYLCCLTFNRKIVSRCSFITCFLFFVYPRCIGGAHLNLTTSRKSRAKVNLLSSLLQFFLHFFCIPFFCPQSALWWCESKSYESKLCESKNSVELVWLVWKKCSNWLTNSEALKINENKRKISKHWANSHQVIRRPSSPVSTVNRTNWLVKVIYLFIQILD